MKYLFCFLLALPLWADKGTLVQYATTRRTGSYTLDSTMTNSGLLRIEARIPNVSCPVASPFVYAFAGFGVYATSTPWLGLMLRRDSDGNCYVVGTNNRDSMTGGDSQAILNLGTRTDITIRYQRDSVGGTFASGARMLMQIWATDNPSDKLTYPLSANASIIATVGGGSATLPGPFNVGDAYTAWPNGDGQLTIAWLKVHSTLVSSGAAPPKACDTADLMDYRFESNGNDSSGAGRNLTMVNASYPDTPAIIVASPRTSGAPFWSNELSLRAGFDNALDGTESYSEEQTCGMSCEWTDTFTPGKTPSRVVWSSQNSCTASVSGTAFGPYEFQLRATAPSGASATKTLQVGAVATDSNGVVITGDANAGKIIDQQIAFGRSAWPYLDDRHKVLSNFYGNFLNNRYSASWRVPMSGTVTVSAGGQVVTGTGMNTANGVTVESIAVNTAGSGGGSGYTSAPTVTLSVAGSGATATSALSGATVGSVTVTNPGSGYVVAPRVVFTGGGGANAFAVANIAGGVVTSITLTNPGSGYSSAPSVSLVINGSGATAVATVSGGTVTSVTVTNPGSGYDVVPKVTFSGGGGSGAGAIAKLARDFVCTEGRDSNDLLVIRYPDVTGTIPGGYRYRGAAIAGCSANRIDLYYPWDGPSVTAEVIGRMTPQEFGIWNGTGDGANYYDNVLAHYTMYYRSGNTVYRDYARTLADRFIENPLNDYFGSNGSGGPFWGVRAPRVKALTGLYLRALDGRSDFWNFMYNNVMVNNNDTTGAGQGYFSSLQCCGYAWTIDPATFLGDRDPREEGYAIAQMAQMAMLYPLTLPNAATRRATLLAAVQDFWTNRWVPTLQADGSQRNYDNDKLAGSGAFTASVSGTSVTAVVGTFDLNACDFNGTTFQNNRIWFVTSGLWLGANDTVDYACTVNSPTSITISPSYAGTPGTYKYGLEGLPGPATQSFMQGIVVQGLYWARNLFLENGDTIRAAQVKPQMDAIIDWVRNVAYRASSKGVYYILSTPSCIDGTKAELIRFCVDADSGPAVPATYNNDATREFVAEIGGAFSRDYLLDTSNTALKTRADLHYGVLYGASGYGGPDTSDGFSGQSLVVPNGRQGKYYGFYFGFGQGSTWDAARLGGLQPADLRSVTLSYDAPADATSTAINLIDPNGNPSNIPCSTGAGSKSCTFTVDRSHGNPLFQIVHTTASGSSSSDILPLKL